MPRKSSIKALPQGVINAINFQLEKERLTLDDLVDWLCKEQGFEVSRSALGRYAKKTADLRAKLAETREIAESFARELGPENVAGKQGALLIEMVHSMLMRFMQQEMKDPDPLDKDKEGLDTKNFMELCRAIKDVSQANRFNQDYVTKLRDQIASEEREKAAKAVDAVVADSAKAGGPGLSADLIEQIKQKVLYG